MYMCRWTDEVWFGALGLTEGNKEINTIGEWLMARRNEPGTSSAVKEEVATMLMAVWTIWRKQCSAVFEGAMTNPMATVDEARRLLDEFMKTPKMVEPQTTRKTRFGWLKPKLGYIKFNCDAAWCHRTKRGGIGVIVRNSDRILIGGTNRRTTGQGIAELEAVRWGIMLAKEKGWNRIEVESDLMMVVSQIKGNTHH